jgi:hypothetical protein
MNKNKYELMITIFGVCYHEAHLRVEQQKECI